VGDFVDGELMGWVKTASDVATMSTGSDVESEGIRVQPNRRHGLMVGTAVTATGYVKDVTPTADFLSGNHFESDFPIIISIDVSGSVISSGIEPFISTFSQSDSMVGVNLVSVVVSLSVSISNSD